MFNLPTHTPQMSRHGYFNNHKGGVIVSVASVPSSPTISPTGLLPPALPIIQTPSSRRPKLSLQTKCSGLSSQNSTGLRLDTLSATSPTVRNTYRNTYEAPLASSTSLRLDCSGGRSISPQTAVQPLPISSPPTCTSAATSPTSSSTSPETPTIPYARSNHLKSILKNSPIPPHAPLRTTISSACPAPKLLFPPIKRVKFQLPLAEEIHTSKYSLRHSDIPSREVSPSPLSCREENLHAGDKRESPSLLEHDSDDEDESEYPKTPIAGRRKKMREWVWTLGPIEGTTSPRPERPP